MRVLVIGSGGREHAICWKLKQSSLLTKLYCAPGNPGIGEIAQNLPIASENVAELVSWAKKNAIDLTVVGPEAPLALGIVNEFEAQGLKIFGPRKEAALMEASKSFAKEIMLSAGVRTAQAKVFSDAVSARNYIESKGAPIVIKADGLAAGKGVVVANTLEEAREAINDCLLNSKFGNSGATVLIEDFLVGREASVIAMIEGGDVCPFVVSQDYKRLEDGDCGPNTGGMGSISPTPVLHEERLGSLVEEIFQPVIRELKSRGIDYKGFLYAGVMVDPNGVVSVVEFNCRLGDPETQVLMMRLDSDFLEALSLAVEGRLSEVRLSWKSESAVCVVCASKGYPGTVEDGKEISGLDTLENDSLITFHAGTVLSGVVKSKGGRILGVTSLGANVLAAANSVYGRIATIDFEGMHYRKDIGSEG